MCRPHWQASELACASSRTVSSYSPSQNSILASMTRRASNSDERTSRRTMAPNRKECLRDRPCPTDSQGNLADHCPKRGPCLPAGTTNERCWGYPGHPPFPPRTGPAQLTVPPNPSTTNHHHESVTHVS